MIERRDGVRAGTLGLTLLADTLNLEILKSLADGALSVPDLRRSVGTPPKTTLRNRLRHLEEAGAVERHQDEGFPRHASYELTLSGHALRGTSDVLASWLHASPAGALQIGSPAARSAIKALMGAWSSNMIRALAAKPLSLTELDRVLAGVNYPALERRLDAMRVTGQVVSTSANGSRPYNVTRWLREAVAPLIAVIGWERRAPVDTPAVHRLDVEALFLLAIPMLRVVGAPDGACRLEVRLTEEECPGGAGVIVTIAGGKPTSCRANLEGDAPSWVSGTTAAWLRALSGADQDGIEVGGNRKLPETILSGFRTMLQARKSDEREFQHQTIAATR